MKLTELITQLEALREKHGDLPVYIPYNCGSDDFKESLNSIAQKLYFHPFNEVEKEVIVIRNF